MLLERLGDPLRPAEIPTPEPSPDQVRIRVRACAVCRTDLHIVDGDLSEPRLPLVPGHEIVGEIDALGANATGLALGQRIGIPWLGGTCGGCEPCREGRENLCDRALFTGYQVDGGFAEQALVDHRYAFPIPESYSDIEAAPLLCAGLIGYRAYSMAGNGPRLGLYGFGAAAHIIAQVAVFEGREVYAFTRPGDSEGQRFARSLGAVWAGGSDSGPDSDLDAAIIFAPVGSLVPAALAAVREGGKVICAGIHMSDIPAFPYRLLWGERTLRSVANLTRRDGEALLDLAARVPVRTEVQTFALEEANEALEALRAGRVRGAAVLVVG